jgi:hypothetical protein
VGVPVTGDDAATKGYVDGRLGTVPYTLPDGELNLYVNGTVGNDDNDGLGNNAGHAFATIDRAVQWVNGKQFYGRGHISIRIADGEYQQTGNGYIINTKFVDTPPYGFAADLYQSIANEKYRVRVIGNMSNPSNVLITLDGSQSSNHLNGAHFYGLSFRHNFPGIFKDCLGSINDSEVTCCRFLFGPDADATMAYPVRCSGNGGYLSGSIEIIFESAKQCEVIIVVAISRYHIGSHGQDASGNSRLIDCSIAVIGDVTANETVQVSSELYVLPGYNKASSFTGSGITGKRYRVIYPGAIRTSGYGANFFPGTVAGTADAPASLIS